MEDKINELYNLLNESKDFKGAFTSPDQLRSTLEKNGEEVYNLINESEDFKGAFTSYDEFSSAFLKKKIFRPHPRNPWRKNLHQHLNRTFLTLKRLLLFL